MDSWQQAGTARLSGLLLHISEGGGGGFPFGLTVTVSPHLKWSYCTIPQCCHRAGNTCSSAALCKACWRIEWSCESSGFLTLPLLLPHSHRRLPLTSRVDRARAYIPSAGASRELSSSTLLLPHVLQAATLLCFLPPRQGFWRPCSFSSSPTTWIGIFWLAWFFSLFFEKDTSTPPPPPKKRKNCPFSSALGGRVRILLQSLDRKKGHNQIQTYLSRLKHIRGWFEIQFKSNNSKCNSAQALRSNFKCLLIFWVSPQRTWISLSKEKNTYRWVETSQLHTSVHVHLKYHHLS